MAFGKKEDVFFTLFKDYSGTLLTMGKEFSAYMHSFPGNEHAAEKMKDFESLCDTKKHAIMHQLNDSFVTPFDREDIFTMANQLDDLADFMEDAACKFGIYNIHAMREEALELSKILVDVVEQVDLLFHVLPDNRKNNGAKEAVVRINGLEDKGDYVYRQALSHLFHEEHDTLEILKWRELYKLLEDGIDAGEELADTVEGILTKNA